MARKYKTYSGPRLPKNPEAKRRYRVYYYRMADTDEYAVQQDTSGSTDNKSRAFGLAAGHCGAAELDRGEYAKAIVIDSWKGRFLRVYTLKPGQMIQIKEY